jgi:hypothetical protein
MPRRFAMSTLVTRCKQRADRENDDHISASEWKTLISEQYGDLFQVVAESGLRYFEYTSTLTATGAAYVSEPADHLSTVRIDYLADGTTTGTRRPLTEIMAQEQPYVSGQTGSEARYYALVDDRIYLYPTPPTGQSYEIVYIPQAPSLAAYADADTVDLVTADGELFLIWGVAVKALAKSESDVRLALSERDQARQRLLEWATLRAFNQPRRRFVADVDDGLYVDAADWRYR